MTYFLGDKAIGHSTLSFEYLDGDIGKVENEDRSIDIGINPPSSTQAMCFGRRVKTEFLPTRIRPNTSQTRIPDLHVSWRGCVCSTKFRDIVEALEPGVHQFVPVEVVRKNGDHLADMFFFVCCNRLDTLELDLLRPPPKGLGFHSVMGGGTRTVFNGSRIGSHHIWIDKRVLGCHLWVSDTFHDAASAAGLTGVNMLPQETV